MRVRPLVAVSLALTLTVAGAQVSPDADIPLLHAESDFAVCLDPQVGSGFGPPGPVVPATPDEELTPEAREQRARRQAFRELMPAYLARLPEEVTEPMLMPVEGVRVAQVANTFSAPRSGGRSHQGQDIFAPRWTPIRSATTGIVLEVSDRFLGGRGVMILGPGWARYFYTHLEAYADDLREGMWVTPNTVIGFVGNDGNASTTPTHLHFAVYEFDRLSCRHRAFDPLPYIVDRSE